MKWALRAFVACLLPLLCAARRDRTNPANGVWKISHSAIITDPMSGAQSYGIRGRTLLQGASEAGVGAGQDASSGSGVGGSLSVAAGVQSGSGTEGSSAGNSEANDGVLQAGVTGQDWEQSGGSQPPGTPETTVSAAVANLAALGFAVISIPEDIPAPNNYQMQPRFDEGLTQQQYTDLLENHEIFKNGTSNMAPAPDKAKKGPASAPTSDTIIIEVSPGRFVDTGIPRDQLVTEGNFTNGEVPPLGR